MSPSFDREEPHHPPRDTHTLAGVGITDRITRLEVWREADRERALAFEREMRDSSSASLAKMDSVAAEIRSISISLASQSGLRQVVSWASAIVLVVLSGLSGFFLRHLLP